MSSASITDGDNAHQAVNTQATGGKEVGTDKETVARIKIAGCPHTCPEVLQALAIDCDPGVRTAVALNPCTPNPVLALLARDPDAKIRLALARSLSTNIELLRQLALDSDETVAAAARLSFKIAEIEMNAKNRDLANETNRVQSMRRRIA